MTSHEVKSLGKGMTSQGERRGGYDSLSCDREVLQISVANIDVYKLMFYKLMF